jgi:hypothetical protein
LITNHHKHKDMTIEMIEPDAVTTGAEVMAPPAKRAELALNSTQTERDLLAAIERHKSITVVKDAAGRDQAHSAAMELMRARTTIEKVSKAARDDATKFAKAVVAEEKRLIAIVEGEEKRLKALRDAWDEEQERIKREAEEAERKRVEGLQARIRQLSGLADLALQCRGSERAQALLDKATAFDLSDMQELTERAKAEQARVIAAVTGVVSNLLAREAEAARLAAERAELERVRAEQEAQAAALAAERAEIERLRAAMEEAKAPSIAHLISASACFEPAIVVEQPAAATQRDDDIVDAEIRAGFDAAMTAPPPEQPQPTGTPSADSLIKCIAFEFGVEQETACRWLCERADDFLEWTAAFPVSA